MELYLPDHTVDGTDAIAVLSSEFLTMESIILRLEQELCVCGGDIAE